MVTLRMRWVSDSFFDVFKIKKYSQRTQRLGNTGNKDDRDHPQPERGVPVLRNMLYRYPT